MRVCLYTIASCRVGWRVEKWVRACVMCDVKELNECANGAEWMNQILANRVNQWKSVGWMDLGAHNMLVFFCIVCFSVKYKVLLGGFLWLLFCLLSYFMELLSCLHWMSSETNQSLYSESAHTNRQRTHCDGLYYTIFAAWWGRWMMMMRVRHASQTRSSYINGPWCVKIHSPPHTHTYTQGKHRNQQATPNHMHECVAIMYYICANKQDTTHISHHITPYATHHITRTLYIIHLLCMAQAPSHNTQHHVVCG